MSENTTTNLPSQKELEQEISDYLSSKYGERVKIVTTGMIPQSLPKENDTTGKIEIKKDSYKNFYLKPEELVTYLDEYVVQQHEAKAVLATKICTHFNRIRYLKERQNEDRGDVGRIKNNVLLIGSTGVGKTYLIKLIARKIGVPFVKGDATKFSETGYVGGDVEDLVRDLVREADGDIDKAQFGIIYIDEVDKISKSQHRIGADISRSGVQRALLKPMEETDVELKVPHDIISQMEAVESFRASGKREKKCVNTKNILFIMSGAFDGLDEIISKRNQQRTIGFEGVLSSVNDFGGNLKHVKAEDLIHFGFESEFVGRLPIVAVLNLLTEEDYYQILINPNCPVVLAKKQDFLVYGITISIMEESYREVARLAVDEKTGARGLVSVIEKALLPFEQKLPSTEIKYLAVTPELIATPADELNRLLDSKKVQLKHQKICKDLCGKERNRIVEFIKLSRDKYLADQGIVCTDQKMNLIASICHQENMDITEGCEYFIDLISHINNLEKKISETFELEVVFKEDAVDYILGLKLISKSHIDEVGIRIMTAFEYGLRLMTHKKHVDKVEIPASGVENPEQYINELVEKIFKL